ncbi:hypothetical protein SCHPADRAFT_996409 [Schizopora paradoxa]|uniref:Fungal-type protein kinase domain-containing protein n=1 Tax=Schizopora paradoxa TaxID=27342 RepID=A0A0H2RRN1_9AGAM|nr:hypothetical protein SCHPADRAFT_996409 [Schizopora paradoxa]
MEIFWLDEYFYLKELLGEELFDDELEARGEGEFCDMIVTGRNHSKTDDVSGVTKNLGGFYPFKVAPLQDKAFRGYNHDDCAFLLAPAKYDLKDDSTRQGLRNFLIVPKHDDWPRFMYEGYTCDPNVMKKGWLMSDILLRLHYALSSQAQFYTNDPEEGASRDRFPYQRFYYAIITLYSELQSELDDIVIPFWNKRLFANSVVAVDNERQQTRPTVQDDGPSAAELMRQQKRPRPDPDDNHAR